MTFTKEIESTIKATLSDALVYVSDPMQDNTHLEAVVISDRFIQMSLVKQHQTVMNLLKEHFNTSLHALKLKTFTPDQWQQQKDN